MGKHGEAHEARKERTRHIKTKTKFANKNSIGKTRTKTRGAHNAYVSRTKAVKTLQLTLKDFRKLCILKGIYPREPTKKLNSGAPTTYYFAKDIAFLAHEPLLHKFREQKAFLKKVRRAVGRHEKKKALRLDARRPEYTLDHLIRERYPSFTDALADLDDALALVSLFGSLSPSKYVPPARIATCARLAREWNAYVAHSRSLRKTFVSIKGVYFQAEVHGVTLTWVTPHSFAQQPTAAVDYRVMLSFLELYEALLTLVNFKLYHAAGLVYPPQLNLTRDVSVAPLSSTRLEAVSAAPTRMVANAAVPSAATKPLSSGKLASLRRKLSAMEAEGAEDGADADDAVDVDAARAADARATEDDDPLHTESLAPDELRLRTLFKGLVFFCSRETPLAALEFAILSCGGTFCWAGEGSPSAEVTHHVIDRPLSDDAAAALAPRELLQPQWVFDCVNARDLLPPHPYRPGRRCPPHLSPFHDGAEGYTPAERIHGAIADASAKGGSEAAAEEESEGDASASVDEEDADESESEDGEEEDDEDDPDDEAAEYARELKAELAGAPSEEGGKRKRRKAPAASAEEKQKAEEKELAKLMMTRKKRKLYDRMQFGIKRKEAAADVLRQKRIAIDEAARTTSKRGAGSKKQRTSR